MIDDVRNDLLKMINEDRYNIDKEPRCIIGLTIEKGQYFWNKILSYFVCLNVWLVFG
jgi:hypothetical protein